MIVSRITMGLGNQMFQYAAARALSLEKNVPLKVDVFSYDGYNERKYELETFFTINPQKVTRRELVRYHFTNPVKQLWNKILPQNKLRTLGLPYEEKFIPKTLLAAYDFFSSPQKRKTYTEPAYHYQKHFFRANSDIYLIGFWMSWQYFEKYKLQIKKDFTVRPELVAHLQNIATEIRSQNSAAIHIRRGDFTTAKNISLHGVISIDFYTKAINEIVKKSEDAHFFIFSDDIKWVKKNLKTKSPVTYISNEITNSAIEDFYLMTQCHHNIIANSTFSWWAAYLNNNADKIVIAPQKWYNNATYNYKDVYPSSWTILHHF